MRARDLNYLSHIPSIDCSFIGALLNESAHHRVYEYGQIEIIKVPRHRFNFLYSERSHLEADLAIVKRYFPGLAVRTIIHSSENHDHHCIVQDKVLGFQITPAVFRQLKHEFRVLLQTNRQLLQEKRASLDFLGGAGLATSWGKLLGSKIPPYLSNMTVIKKGTTHQLKLLDTELLRIYTPKLNTQDILRYLLSLGSFRISEFFLRKFFFPLLK